MEKKILSFVALICLFSCSNNSSVDYVPEGKYAEFREPHHYICPRVDDINIDGDLEEWQGIEWTEFFNDIEGASKEKPRHQTRAKMAWNDEYLFIAAEMEEPHVWASITERDEVIFYDNDFEVFIDPDGDSHHYYELEVNAFETAWDLLLTMPYRDFGFVIDSWDLNGMKIGVSVQGTINDPSDLDQGWTLELALPFEVLQECAEKGSPPAGGDYWRINFSRVEWKTEIKDGKYMKILDPATGKHLPEDNWVWSPQYHINMHMPEYWGFIVFSDQKDIPNDNWELPKNELIKWHLRNVYYQQKAFYRTTQAYASSVADLAWEEIGYSGDLQNPAITLTPSGYQATMPAEQEGKKWIVNEKGRIYLINQ